MTTHSMPKDEIFRKLLSGDSLDFLKDALARTLAEIMEVEIARLTGAELHEKSPERQTTARIQAHVMLTILAANCARYLEPESGHSIAKLTQLFKPVLAARMSDGKREHWECNGLGDELRAILARLGIGVPPAAWDKWIEVAKAKPKALKSKTASQSGARRRGG